jgi:crotonobetaine/carnitine-CoA ligase
VREGASFSERVVTLPQLLAERAETDPDRVFVQEVGGSSATYAQLWQSARLWSDAYRRLGVGAGEAVLTMLPFSLTAMQAWLGAAAIKAWDVPVNTMYRGRMLEHVLSNSDARVLVVSENYLEPLAEAAERTPRPRTVVVPDASGLVPECPFAVLTLAEFLAGASVPDGLDEVHPWDVCSVIYTSGTTGASKGVVMPWAQVHATAVGTFPFEDLGEDDVFYAPSPAYHIGAKVLPYLAALVNGRLVLREMFSATEFWDDVCTYGCTTTGMVGTIANFLSQQEPRADDANTPLRNVVMAPLAPDLEAFERRFGVRVCTAYSMTELSIPFNSRGWQSRNWQSCGRVREGYPGYDVRIVDEHDYEVPTGEFGELVVRTAVPWTLNAGYLGMPEATADAWRNGWFHTGDGFVRDGDGYYYFVDRIKDAIRRRGENISSFEVEADVNAHPAVLESAAVAVASELGEDEVKVVVVAKPGQTFTPEALIEFLASRMPRFMIPRYVEVVDELPQTPTMRVRKALLREHALNERTWDREAAGIELPAR